MLNYGKHAKISLERQLERVFKTYKNSIYVENELFALNFLAKIGILDLKPKKETEYTLSFSWLNDTTYTPFNEYDIDNNLVINLVLTLKKLHTQSFLEFGYYLTHEDLFADNMLLRKSDRAINIIDWGLSGKRDNVYPDMASLALGIFNKNSQVYSHFLCLYFDTGEEIDFNKIRHYAEFLYNEYLKIRIENGIEIESLTARLNNAVKLINVVENSYL